MASLPRKNWSRDELIVAMNLYTQLSFGQFHARQPLIIAVAERLGRSSDSLAMKLCNLASFDPAHRERGVSGLKAASRLDREAWEQFEADWETMGTLSEMAFERLMARDWRVEEQREVASGLEAYIGDDRVTDRFGQTKQRVGQDFFRRAVMISYQGRCCITGNPIPELLTASHILPWRDSGKDRLNPSNGLCLAKTQDAAFDKGLITFDSEFRIVLSKSIRDRLTVETVRQNFAQYEGKTIALPHRFQPDERFLSHHRETVFVP